MAYEDATTIIAAACVECGLDPVADPYASTDSIQVQMRVLLNQCGRELMAIHQWQQFVRSYTIDTGADPSSTDPEGEYDLPSDFGYMINQTGWTPTNVGMGLPLGGPLTQQQYTYLVATNLASSTIYVSFLVQEGVLQVLPAPAPADTDITFQYMSTGWVDVLGAGTTFASSATAASDVIQYEPIMISKMLAARYKQAKGLDASASQQQFQAMFALYTGVNAPAPVLSLVNRVGFPYLNPYLNIPQTGFGS